MGMYDEYDGQQMKIGDDLTCHNFEIGDEVTIPDGAYLTWEGVVVIHDGRLVCTFPTLTTKWGDAVQPGVALYGATSLLACARMVANRDPGGVTALRQLVRIIDARDQSTAAHDDQQPPQGGDGGADGN
jgi:hypothetical protein